MGEKEKILIADDDTQIIAILTDYLTSQNYEVKSTPQGSVALIELQQNYYDLCLLDIKMPDLSGLDILSKIRQDDKKYTSIIMLTGIKDIDAVLTAMRNGADDYIQKPFHLEELGISIRKTLENRRIKLENIRYKTELEKEVEEKTKEIKEAYFGMIHAFANAIEMRDSYTGNHIKKVSRIAVLLGKGMGFSKKKLEELNIAAILHDIGKIGIPDDILTKPSALTKIEYDKIKKHPEIGYDIIKNIESMRPIMPYILYHQERFNGTGYPKGLKGEKIPVEVRILSLADALEAMTSDRPYRKKMTLEEAYEEIISNAGKQFDPNIVDIFVKLWE